MNLRPYQRDCIAAVHRTFQTCQSQLVVMPTGTGKTVVFSGLARDWPGRSIIIAHRGELLEQAADKLLRTGIGGVAIEMAEESSREDIAIDYRDRAVVASVQSLCRPKRLARFNPQDFGLVIVDEAHHAVARTYRVILDHFAQNESLKILGVTATPRRADDLALGQVFDQVGYEYAIEDAINDGWLVPVNQRVVKVDGLDFSGVRTVAGDFNEADLEAILAQEKHLHAVAAPTKELAGDRPTLLFCVTVNHAELLAEVLNRYKIGSAKALSGKTDSETRAKTLAEFKAGRLQFLCNCMLFTEGFDAPNTALVVMARPTKSLSLYVQVLGRGTRPLPGVVDPFAEADASARRQAIAESGKPFMTVLDFVGNSGRHKIVTAADVLGGKYGAPIRARAKQIAEEAADDDKAVAVEASLEEAADDLDVLEFVDNWRREVKAKAQYSAQEVSPFAGGSHSASVGTSRHGDATEKQINYLVRLGVSRETAQAYSKRQAGVVIDKLLERRGK